MLIYTLITVLAGLLLATLVALVRQTRELRESRRRAQCLEGWAERNGPRRAQLRVLDGGRP